MKDEFPRMQRGEPSLTTRARLNRIDQMNARFQPPDPNGVQLASNSDRLIDRITVLRAERIAASRASLPMTFGLVLILGALQLLLWERRVVPARRSQRRAGMSPVLRDEAGSQRGHKFPDTSRTHVARGGHC